MKIITILTLSFLILLKIIRQSFLNANYKAGTGKKIFIVIHPSDNLSKKEIIKKAVNDKHGDDYRYARIIKQREFSCNNRSCIDYDIEYWPKSYSVSSVV